MKLAGVVAIVTGASRGIGQAVAECFAREGARLVLCSRSAPDVEGVARTIRHAGGEAIGLKADVSQERDVDRLTAETLKAYGRADVLVNNAGLITARAPIHQVKVTDWDAVMAVNLRGPFLCIRSILPHLLKQGSGSIINVSSGAGKRAAPSWGPYAVSKFGIEGLTQAVAEETHGTGVRVNAINPGGTRTQMRAAVYPEEDPQQLATPEERTGVFVFLASEASRDVTGQSFDTWTWLAEHPEWQ